MSMRISGVIAGTALLVAGLLSGCAAHSSLEPAGRGVTEPNIGVGGPVLQAFGVYLPLPYATLGATHGISDRFNLDANLHLLPLAYELGGAEFGGSWFPTWQPGGTTLGLHGRLLGFASFKSNVESRFRLYPMFSATAAWRCRAGLLYAGADLTLPFTRPDYDPGAVHRIVSPFVGYRWPMSERLAFITELRWQAANVESDRTAVTYAHLGGHGAVAPFFTVQWLPGRGGER